MITTPLLIKLFSAVSRLAAGLVFLLATKNESTRMTSNKQFHIIGCWAGFLFEA
jgi:hypothetical protein